MERDPNQLLREFFTVMGNEYRLRMAGQLMTKPQTSTELAAAFGLKPQAVLEHIAAMRHLGLVSAETREGSDTCYRFNTQALYDLNRTLLSRQAQPTPVDHLPDETRKALLPFFQGQRLVSLPSGKKFHLLIGWLATQFEQGVRYNERQVNEIISRYHEDYATLRRALIDARLMERDHGEYWRTG
jgi:hypothetical protein